VKQRRGMDGARTLMHGPEWIPRGASKAHPRDGLRARRPVQPNAPTKRTPPIKARMFWISLTDSVKLRRTKQNRAVDVSEANASARTANRRQLQRLLGCQLILPKSAESGNGGPERETRTL
jgi:hypothetical protein